MSVLKDAINQFDSSEKVSEEIKESLTMLVELAKEKSNTASAAIESDLKTGKLTDNLTVPVTKVVTSKVEYRAKSSDSVEIVNKVAESLGSMFSGEAEILKSIADIGTTALNAIMGAGQGEEAESRFYSVVAEYPAIVRFDFYFWGRNTAAESIRTKIESAFSCVGYKSAVDIAKLDFNTFLALYGPVLKSAYGSDPSKLENMIRQAKEIYNMFTNEPAAIADSDIMKLIEASDSSILIPKVKTIQKSPCGIF